jgi:hypothetical protein
MNDENEKFEKIRELLSNYTPHFCLIYRRKASIAGLKLKWCKASSSDNKTHEEYDKLAATYQEIALNSYRHRRNFILKETPPRANSRGQRWCGIFVHAEPNRDPLPTNSLGQRWWQFVAGAGATRDAGYVIVARIAAKEAKEVQDCIAGIQDIMK